MSGARRDGHSVSAKFEDYVKEVEATLSDEERAKFDAFRAVDALRVRTQALADFDRLAPQAAERLSYRLWGSSEPLIALARERMIDGFDLYPDGPMFEKTADELSKEADEELADAIVYVVQELLRNRPDQPSETPGESK